MLFQSRTMVRPEFEDGQTSTDKVLLSAQILVADDEQIKTRAKVRHVRQRTHRPWRGESVLSRIGSQRLWRMRPALGWRQRLKGRFGERMRARSRRFDILGEKNALSVRTMNTSLETTDTCSRTTASRSQTMASRGQIMASCSESTASRSQTMASCSQTMASCSQSTASRSQSTASVTQTTASRGQTMASRSQSIASRSQSIASRRRATAACGRTNRAGVF
jgi:hypothetical protein